MTDARETILARIRSALGRGASPDLAAERASVPRNYIRSGSLDLEARLHLLMDRLHDYDAHVVQTSADSLPRTIAALLAEHHQKKVIAAAGLPEAVLPGEFPFLPEEQADIQDLNDCDGIVTLCTLAIAATGTIVLTHGPGEGARRLTLLPERHLCVVRAEQVVETVPEALARLGPLASRPITLISGPSATADIEMTRIRGVHGPRFLEVALVR